MVRESQFKSEEPGFDPLVGQGRGDCFLFCPSESMSREDVSVPDSSSCVRHVFKCVRTLKIPLSICRAKSDLTDGVWKPKKHCSQENKRLGSAVL